jgi:hypothetical protein
MITGKRFAATVCTGLILASGALAAFAEQMDYQKATVTPFWELSEGRIGFGATDPTTGHELSADVSAELLLQPVGNDDWIDELRFRPAFGLNGNLEGRTSFAYVGGTFDVLNFDSLFFDITFGGAVHDGYLHLENYATATHKELGSRFEFREALEAGYQISGPYSVSLYVDHLSNAGWLSRYNQGLETAGVHLNLMFD